MGQHYIPRYYLSGFGEPSDPSNVWVYEKGTRRVFSTTVKTAANENNRWPEDIEQYLANQIEEPANPVLDKIRNRQLITESDKDVLSTYMVCMLMRVPKGLARTKATAPKVLDKVFDDVRREILRLMTEHPSKKTILENRLEELPGLRSKYETDFPIEVWYQNLDRDALPRLRAVLPTMTWTFLTSDKRQPLLTSDNPVFFFESLGIGKSESEVTFPISSEVALWASWRKSVTEGYVAVKDAVLREINRRTASAATRYVYYSHQVQWVVNLINKKNPRLNRLRG